jgi:hypothetical protein
MYGGRMKLRQISMDGNQIRNAVNVRRPDEGYGRPEEQEIV